MSWIREVTEEEAQGEVREFYQQYLQRLGYVPHIMTVSSLTPGAMQAHYTLYRAIMFTPGELSRIQREMLATLVSTLNHCHY